MKEPINKVDNNVVSLIRTSSLCKEEVVVHVQQIFINVSIFLSLSITLWTSLQLENMLTIEMNTDWKSLHFRGPEQAIEPAKK